MPSDQTDAEILAEAKERFRRCEVWESKAREHAKDDAKFANADAYHPEWQWPGPVLTSRGNRPCLVQNKTRQHNLHIVNDARQHKAQIKVTPTGGQATYEAAQIMSAIIRRIEYQSKAVDAYSTGIYHQVESGIGYARVVTDYVDEHSFDQDIFIRRVKDPRTVFLDPDAQEYDKGDGRFAFVFDNRPRDEAKLKYGKDLILSGEPLGFGDPWDTDEHVRECEYWRRGERDETLHELEDGTTIRESELPKGAKAHLSIKRSRPVAVPEVERILIVGNKVVKREAWPGCYIPIVPFIGEEVVIDGQMDRKGHTRALIDAQRMLNYWESAAVEHVALQTKSPFITPLKAIEGLENYWNSANTENRPFLPYHDRDIDGGSEIAPPKRAEPPVMAQAFLQGLVMAKQDMMEVSGQYQAEMGAPGNERSGTAIQQRQREGDTATYHYIDNQAKAIRQIGRICLDLIPKTYDVPRVIKIMAQDGTQSDVHVDPSADTAHQHVMQTPTGPQPLTPDQADQMQEAQDGDAKPDVRVIFNPNVGRYDVEADVGPSFGTQREEAFNAFSQLVQQNKELAPVIADLWMKTADFPVADEAAERLRRMVPQQALGGPTQTEQALQAKMQSTLQHGQQLAQQADAEIATLRAQVVHLTEQAKDKDVGLGIDEYKAQTDRLGAVTKADPEVGKMLVRSMLSDLIGAHALPVIHAQMQADAEHMQAIAPEDTDQEAGQASAA